MKIETSPLELAVKSDAILKLHLHDSCGVALDVPIKSLIKEKEEDTASYANLHHCALTALFRYEPNQTYPAYAVKSFRLIAHYETNNGTKMPIRSDEDLTKALESASTEHLMDDNDGIILHVHCKFMNNRQRTTPYECEEAKKFRESASRAAKQTGKKLRKWALTAQRFMGARGGGGARKNGQNKEVNGFVVVNDENRNKDDPSPVEWVSRFVHLLFAPEVFNEKSLEKKKEVVSRSLDTATDVVVESFERMADLVNEIYEREKDFYAPSSKRSTTTRKDFCIPSPTPSLEGCSIPSSNSFDTADSQHEGSKKDESDAGVEIVFDPEGKSTPEEWKIFFGESQEQEGVVVEEAESFCSADDGMLVASPADDVQSMASAFSEISKPSIEDDGSWALCDDI